MDIPNSSGFRWSTYCGATKYDLGENSRGKNEASIPGACYFFFSGHCRAGSRCSHSHNHQTRAVLGPEIQAASSSQYDPVNDSMDLIMSITRDYEAGVALISELPPTGNLVGVSLHGTDRKDVERMAGNVRSHQSSENQQLSDCREEKQSLLKAEEIAERKDKTDIADNERDVKADERKVTGGKSVRAFKFALAEFVKKLLIPTWNERKIDKEAYKTIVEKVVKKVIFSVHSTHIPETQENIRDYLAASKPNISKLLQAYLRREKEKAKERARARANAAA